MAARNLGSTGRTAESSGTGKGEREKRLTRLMAASRQVRGGWTAPRVDPSWWGRFRDRLSWRLVSWSLMIGTRWYREMISGALALGMDTAKKEAGKSNGNG